jgi:hypothetical protein
MKKQNGLIVSFLMIATSLFIGCSSPAQRVENAEDNVNAANEELDAANRDYLADMESFRITTNERILLNDQKIAAFKVSIKSAKREARLDYESRIVLLEQKNNDMRKSLKEYNADGKANWEAFKVEFSHDMDELNSALNSLVTNDVK